MGYELHEAEALIIAPLHGPNEPKDLLNAGKLKAWEAGSHTGSPGVRQSASRDREMMSRWGSGLPAPPCTREPLLKSVLHDDASDKI